MITQFARRAKSTMSAATYAAPKKESTFVRVWIKQSKAAWPIIGIAAGVVVFCGAFVVHTLQSPELHFNRHHRQTFDYIENDRDSNHVAWTESKFHKGPSFAHPTKRAFDFE